MSWVLIWRGNWMTRDSLPSLPHESAEFSWLVPPTTAAYRRWAGYGQLSAAHSSFCVSISSSGRQFEGAAETTHSPTLQWKGLYGGSFLMGIWSRVGRMSQVSQSMATVLFWQHVIGFCMSVTEQLWPHVESRGVCLDKTDLFNTSTLSFWCDTATNRHRRIDMMLLS